MAIRGLAQQTDYSYRECCREEGAGGASIKMPPHQRHVVVAMLGLLCFSPKGAPTTRAPRSLEKQRLSVGIFALCAGTGQALRNVRTGAYRALPNHLRHLRLQRRVEQRDGLVDMGAHFNHVARFAGGFS